MENISFFYHLFGLVVCCVVGGSFCSDINVIVLLVCRTVSRGTFARHPRLFKDARRCRDNECFDFDGALRVGKII